jgi:hypothetical protein
MMSDTYNITIKCDSAEERDIVLEKVDELISDNIVRYGDRNNVFFSENKQQWFSEQEREVN